MPSFKLTYEDSENIKADRVNTAVVILHQIKLRAFSFGYPVFLGTTNTKWSKDDWCLRKCQLSVS